MHTDVVEVEREKDVECDVVVVVIVVLVAGCRAIRCHQGTEMLSLTLTVRLRNEAGAPLDCGAWRCVLVLVGRCRPSPAVIR